jgi:hypothetical protein
LVVKKRIVAQRLLRPPLGISVVEALSAVRPFFPLLTLIFRVLTSIPAADPPADGVKRRKKRNRWGDAQENKAAGLMGLPTMIMANFTTEQLEAYTLHLRIEEISQKLRINDVVPADGDRSVSTSSLGSISRFSDANKLSLLGHLLHPRSTITLEDVLTPESTATASVSRTSVINLWKKP